ncbi:MAG TPA: DMT family transporter [Candidatus Methylomirabilis sp.]|nr:DMT family transporter [Candidatus Methylomirabilis sp.]
MSDITWGILGGLGTGLTWGTISLLVRSLSGTIAPVGITAMRSVLGGGILLLVAVVTGYGGEIARMPLWVVLTLWGSIIIAMGFGDTMFFVSMDHLGVTRALTLTMINPLLTTVVGIGLLGEPVTPLRALGMLLVVGGLALVISGKGEAAGERRGSTRRGLRLVCLAAGSWAVSAIIMKPAFQAVSVMAAAAVRIPAAGVVLWLTPWTRGVPAALVRATRQERLRLGAICLLSAVGSLLFTTGIKYGGVAVGNVLSATSPLFTLPFEVWVLGRRASRQTAFGALVTVSGIGLMNL